MKNVEKVKAIVEQYMDDQVGLEVVDIDIGHYALSVSRKDRQGTASLAWEWEEMMNELCSILNDLNECDMFEDYGSGKNGFSLRVQKSFEAQGLV